MRRILLLLIILTPLISFSQENKNPTYTISGKIIDASSKKPLEDATIVFKDVNDDQILFGGISNARGNFSVDVEEGNYRAYVEYIYYKTKELNISTINRDFNIGTISLEVDIEYLNEVEIVGEKKSLEFKQNKVVFNVEKDIAAEGSTASEILNNIPSVTIDPEGTIKVRGQSEVQVLINGKTSLLSKENALKSLPAGSIDKIEVITNPSARYRASSLNVINIILKKGKDEGLNASVTTTAGYKDHYGALITLNHKTAKANFFTHSSYNHSNLTSIATYENEYFENNNSTSFLNEKSDFNSKNNTFYGRIGADFYLTKRTTLTPSINFQYIDQNRDTETFSDIFDTNYIPTINNTRDYTSKFNNEAIEFVLDFEHNFKKEGKKLTSSITYTKDVDDFDNKIVNTNTSYTNEEFNEHNKLTNTIVEINYASPLGKSSSYLVGYFGEYGKVPFKISGSRTNDIEYSEKIHAAFIEYEYETDKMYFGAGLRAEFLDRTVDYNTLNLSQTDNFDNLFPSAYYQYALSDTKSISLSYSKSITRPGYYQLQPFEQRYSETSSYKGNPDLDPIFVDNLSLTYSYYGEKFTIVPSLIYQKWDDFWQNITYETGEKIDDVNKTITYPVNIGKLDYYGGNISFSYKPIKILNFSGNFLLMNFDQSGNYEVTNSLNETIVLDYNFDNLNCQLSVLTQVKLPNLFNFQTNVNHFFNSKGPYSERKAYTYANAAISKDIFNDNATLTLTVDDIFMSNKIKRDRFDSFYFSKSETKNKFQTILLSFTYRFNQSKKDRKIEFDRKENKPKY